MPNIRTGKPKMVDIRETCKLCRFKLPGCKVYGMETKPGNCPSWSRCIRHMETIHYFLGPKDWEEALANPKAHWGCLEESKARKRGIETRFQGQSTLDDCVEEFGHRSVETKR